MAGRTRASKDQRNRERYPRRKRWLSKQKEKPCERCGVSYPAPVMEFHHRDPETKLFNISGNLNRSQESLLAEIAKCILLCANCHRLEEAGL